MSNLSNYEEILDDLVDVIRGYGACGDVNILHNLMLTYTPDLTKEILKQVILYGVRNRVLVLTAGTIDLHEDL